MKRAVTSIDSFGYDFEMTFNDGSRTVTTYMGSCLTLMTVLCLMLFIVLKFDVMLNHSDTHIMFSNLEYHYPDDDVLTDRMGFNVAFGLTNFDGKSDFIEDPDYATLEGKYRAWGFD